MYEEMMLALGAWLTSPPRLGEVAYQRWSDATTAYAVAQGIPFRLELKLRSGLIRMGCRRWTYGQGGLR